MVNIARAISAPTRLTTDSSASESRLTEPVSKYAMPLSAIVKMAAEIESQAKRVSDGRMIGDDFMGYFDIVSEAPQRTGVSGKGRMWWEKPPDAQSVIGAEGQKMPRYPHFCWALSFCMRISLHISITPFLHFTHEVLAFNQQKFQVVYNSDNR